MLIKSLAIILIVTTITFTALGESEYFDVDAVKGQADYPDFAFPIFSHPTEENAADKINKLLQIAELKLVKGFENANIFERVSLDPGTIYGGKFAISYEIHTNSPRILSLRLYQSSCGLTCKYWVRYYNFNSGNGDHIQLRDLFTKAGYESFRRLATKRRLADLRRELNRLESSQKPDYETMKDRFEEDGFEDFFVKNGDLFIDGDNSFHKNDKFSGIETVSRIKHPEFTRHLNPYGRVVFSLKNSSIARHRSKELPQIFTGKIAGRKVYLVLNRGYGNEMLGEYVYAKYGMGIFLEGTREGSKLVMVEKIQVPIGDHRVDYVDNGFIKAEFNGKTINGTWRSKDGLKAYRVTLNRM